MDEASNESSSTIAGSNSETDDADSNPSFPDIHDDETVQEYPPPRVYTCPPVPTWEKLAADYVTRQIKQLADPTLQMEFYKKLDTACTEILDTIRRQHSE